MGVLEVSRSIGDGQYKKLGVTCTPDVKKCQLTDQDRFAEVDLKICFFLLTVFATCKLFLKKSFVAVIQETLVLLWKISDVKMCASPKLVYPLTVVILPYT